jgi:hypothetical protein
MALATTDPAFSRKLPGRGAQRRWPEVGFEEIIHLISPKPVSGARVTTEGLTDYFRIADHPL